MCVGCGCLGWFLLVKDVFVWGVVFCGCVSEWFWGCLTNGLAFLPFPSLLGRHGNGGTFGWFGEGEHS